MTSYNYTLGLAVNVSCSYEPTRHVAVRALVPNSSVALEYNAGRHFYDPPIRNITCTVSPQSAIFPVMYKSTTRLFSTYEPIVSSPIAVSTTINDALVALGGIIAEAQNFQANLVPESVITFAVKSFGQPPQQSSPQYLRLFEQMIQGILEYEVCPVDNFHFIHLLIVVPQATYIRLIYSTVPNPPSSCTRTVTGSLSYEVRGWFVTIADIGSLYPMTIINLVALIVLILATVKGGSHRPHPLKPRKVAYHQPDMDRGEKVPEEWRHRVTFQPTKVCCFDLSHIIPVL